MEPEYKKEPEPAPTDATPAPVVVWTAEQIEEDDEDVFLLIAALLS